MRRQPNQATLCLLDAPRLTLASSFNALCVSACARAPSCRALGRAGRVNAMHSSEIPGGDPALRTHESRRSLPSRDVFQSTIEDAYVRFIFYCNPGLTPTVDTKNLRETFRTPPKSGGKTFDTFIVYELVRKFYNKEIKTWTELTTRLGVEPPDLANDESAQKLAQYGVRLKVRGSSS